MRRALDEHDPLARGVGDLLAVRSEVLDSLEDEPLAGPDHLVRRPGTIPVAEEEDVAVQLPGAGAIGDARLFAVDRHRQREPAASARGEHERATLHQEMLAAAGVDEPRADLADLDDLVDAIEAGAAPGP